MHGQSDFDLFCLITIGIFMLSFVAVCIFTHK